MKLSQGAFRGNPRVSHLVSLTANLHLPASVFSTWLTLEGQQHSPRHTPHAFPSTRVRELPDAPQTFRMPFRALPRCLGAPQKRHAQQAMNGFEQRAPFFCLGPTKKGYKGSKKASFGWWVCKQQRRYVRFAGAHQVPRQAVARLRPVVAWRAMPK